MTVSLTRARTAAQRLGAPTSSSSEDLVGHFGCVQAQDFAMAKWAIARRSDTLTNADLDEAFASGRFLRTHILRPTWHLLLPDDLGWLMRLTAPRVHRLSASVNEALGLTDKIFTRAAGVIVAKLSDAIPRTRAELAETLSAAGIDAAGQKLAQIFMAAELEQLICSGPLKDKSHTYVLVPPSVAAADTSSEDETLARLARTYIRGHGPSRPEDLRWWSSLTLAQSRRAFDLAELEPLSINGSTYWSDSAAPTEIDPPAAALMPAFDESISYMSKPLDPMRYPGFKPDLARGGGLLFIDGVIGGGWQRTIRASSIDIDVTPQCRLSRKQIAAIEADAERFAVFLRTQPTLQINS